MTAAGITAISVYFPEQVRENDWWREVAPAFVAKLEQRVGAQVWQPAAERNPWQSAMAPYLDDPFRGSQQRRVLGPGEDAHAMEAAAAQRLLDAAGLTPADIDLVLVSCLFPDQYVLGDAIGLADRMGFTCPCYNLESACGVGVADVVMGCALVESGRARRVLVITACTYSRSADADNPMSLTSGDGAAAFLLAPVPDGHGLLGWKGFATLESATSFGYDIVPDPNQRYLLKMWANADAGRQLETCALKYLPAACHGALADAGLTVDDLDFAIFPTPTAWFAEFGRTMLGLSPDQTIDTYPRFANTGPVLMPQNLYYAAQQGKIGPGDHVLLYTLGSMSSSGAAVLRMSDLIVAPDDAPISAPAPRSSAA
jgi:3-oxoacyl-[acyl-carrier-protein] synthase-3